MRRANSRPIRCIEAAMLQDRDTVTIRGKRILHSTARRDYVCGECGSRLTTRFFENVHNWRTVCTSDSSHDSAKFVTSTAWEYCKATNDLAAQDVLAHLPADVRAMFEA